MRICTIANGNCFMELDLNHDLITNEYYGGISTPTREVFDALRESQDTLLAISYGKQFRIGTKNHHQLIEIPIITGVRSRVRQLFLKITRNFLPVIKKLFSFDPDYIISIDGWTFRHLIPMLFCILSTSKLILVFTAQYSGCVGSSLFRRILVKFLLLSTKLNIIHTVGVRSNSVLSQLHDAGVDETKLRVMSPFFKRDTFPSDREIEIAEHHRFSVLYIGRLVEEKCPLFFVEIAHKLSGVIGSQNIEFTMIGDGSLRDDIYTRLTDLGIEDSFNMLGYQSPKEVFLYLRNSDVLIIPSRCEAFGKVAVEAMIAGTPVIASRVGGLTDIIIDGENGFLCEFGHKSCFQKQITRLYENPDLLKKLTRFTQKHREFWFQQESSFEQLVKDICAE